MIFHRNTIRALALAILLADPAAAQQRPQPLEASVVFEGVDGDLAEALKPVSFVFRNPRNFNALAPIRHAAEADAKVLRRELQSRGYFAARVTSTVLRRARGAEVTFVVDPGPVFDLTGSDILFTDEVDDTRPAAFDALDVEPPNAPTGAEMARIEQALQMRFWDLGFIGADVLDHRIEADFSAAKAQAIFPVRTGPKGHFGEIIVEGNEQTEADFIRQYRTFDNGDLARRQKLDDYRTELSRTGLFTEIDLQPQLPGPSGETNVVVRVSERKHRTLGGGVSYATDIGPGANAYWENRNLFGYGETLRIELSGTELLQELGSTFRKERPRMPGYYVIGGLIRNEDTEAFNAQTSELGGGIGRYFFDRKLTIEGGIRYQYSNISSRDLVNRRGVIIDRDRIFQAVSFPLSTQWNSVDDPLDPQTGFVAGLTTTPYVGTVDFTRVETHYAHRLFWGADDGGTLAWRTKLGAIYGASRNQLPPTERFFAGGGGSIRGYAFQEASPISRQTGDILGGASLAELNVELRQDITGSLEIAVFADAGGAFENNTPDFENVLVGAGAGIRYKTPVGPLRLDVAFPLDRRRFFGPVVDGMQRQVFRDDAFQFYIALGQPF